MTQNTKHRAVPGLLLAKVRLNRRYLARALKMKNPAAAASFLE
jgi:hypothetical protein